MAKPKIIFRDISSQHLSATYPIYLELKKQKFDCEIQLLKVPHFKDLRKFAKKHEDDPYDLLITASLTRWTFSGEQDISKQRGQHSAPPSPRPDFDKSVEKRSKAIFVSHGVGGEETPTVDYHEFKGVFLTGQFWMDLFTNFDLTTYVVKCKYCGKNRMFINKRWMRNNWYCRSHINVYKGKNWSDHVEFIKEYNRGFRSLHLVGMPKLDLVNSPRRFAVAKKLTDEFDLPYEKTVLYAPTLMRLDSFDDTILRLLKLMKDLEVNLIIKPHCDDADEEYQPKLYIAAKKMAGEMRNARWIDPTVSSITPYYLISDVLISASSGCLREFMLTDRPSIQLTNTSEDLRKKFFYEGCVQSTVNDLRRNILRTIYVPETMQKERREEVKRLFHKPDGHATDRAVNKIKELMKW